MRRIQELIRHPRVALVLNLHDGSGYYRANYQNYLCNPARWGQSVIIDQDGLPSGVFMGALAQEAARVTAEVNQRLIKPLHVLHVHNTNTAAGSSCPWRTCARPSTICPCPRAARPGQ